LKDLNYDQELREDQETLEGNALQKARFVYNEFGENCFADDSGLEIHALKGEPGVHSAHYAGAQRSFEDNMNLVLQKMNGVQNRSAQFRTVIALILQGKEILLEGKCEGIITDTKIGSRGFGYDPIFLPNGYNQTFAEMNLELKNKISHRAMAVNKLISSLGKL